MTPLVEAFVVRCKEKQLSQAQFQAAVKVACERFPDVADEFEKAGFDWRSHARNFINGFGTTGGAVLGTIAGAAPGVGVALTGVGAAPGIAGAVAGGALGGAGGAIEGNAISKWVGNKLFGEEKPPEPQPQPPVKAAAMLGRQPPKRAGGSKSVGRILQSGAVEPSAIAPPSTAATPSPFAELLQGIGSTPIKTARFREKEAFLGLGPAWNFGKAMLGKGISGVGKMLPKGSVGTAMVNTGGGLQKARNAATGAINAPRVAAQNAVRNAGPMKVGPSPIAIDPTTKKLVLDPVTGLPMQGSGPGRAVPATTHADADAALTAFGGPSQAIDAVNTHGGMTPALIHHNAVVAANPAAPGWGAGDIVNTGMTGLMVAGMGANLLPTGGQPQYEQGMSPQASYLGVGDIVDKLSRTVKSAKHNKKAFIQELADQWQGLEPQHKAMLVGGGTAALGALVNQLRPRGEGSHPSALMNAGVGLGGLGTAAYGFSGGHPSNLLPSVGKLFGKQPATTGVSDLSKDPALSKYMDQSGEPNFQALVKAPDDELRAGVGHLSSHHKNHLKQKLLNFKPSFGQRLGAKAMGIDIEGQRARFNNLLG